MGPDPMRFRSGPKLRGLAAFVAALLFVACGEAPVQRESAFEQPLILEGVGFERPVAAFYDSRGDSYLIANLGDPNAPERYGFISRVSPRGKVSDLNWIDGRAAGTTLHTPTGLEVQGDTLYVADAGSVRLFQRISGSTRGALEVESAIALRDLTLGPGSMIYVTDAALVSVDGKLEARGIGSIFQIGPDGRPKPYLKRRYLQNPTGIATTPGGLAVLSYSKGELFLIEQRRTPNDPVRLPAAQAQGLVAIRGGQFLASSAAAGGVYRILSDGEVRAEIEGLEQPAGIGFDSRRHRVLITIPSKNRVEIHPQKRDSG
ncbi:MAG: hypothetical protein VX614_00560 [Myxococcota bacterium]|nr:hypothetical protein [Myxococcota bacterium]